MDVRWHPGGFAFACATKFGLELDAPVAIETYDRLVMSTRKEYEALNRTRNRESCLQYWDDLAARWLIQLGQDPSIAPDLSTFARDEMYGENSGCFIAYPETRSALDQLHKEGYRMVVVSNWDYSLDRTLAALGLEGYFERTFASLEYGVEKPDPLFFRAIEEELGAVAREFIHFGDNPLDDLQGARGAGWGAVLVDRSLEAPERPRIPNLSYVSEAITWHA